jgi:A/G-specific adenine glycosylase
VVGEVLLQRTRGEHVVDVYREFLRRWPDPASLANARVNSIARVIRPLGLTKRAPILKRLGVAIVALGNVPADPESLLQLPGLGPYAAHSVPIFAGRRNLPLVDWVIARVLRRYFDFPTHRRPNADKELWTFAAGLARPGRARDLWLGTLDFGAQVCAPRPKCPVCPLRSTCSYARENSFAQV